jgi:transcriptional regulator PpsR
MSLPGPEDQNNPLSGLAPEVASTIVRVAGDIALVIGADGVISNVAESDPLLQGEGKSWVGRVWADTVSSHTRGKALSLLEEVQRHGVSRRRELNHPAPDGQEIPFSWAAVRLGHAGPVLAVGRDLRAVSAIQQRFVEAQQELERGYWQRRETESHYRQLFQVAQDAVLVLDGDTRLVREANPAAAQLFGRPSALLPGHALRESIDTLSRPLFDELLATARASGHAAELRLRTALAGTAIDLSATPFRVEGQPCLLLRARRAEPSAVDPQTVLDFIGQTPDAVVVTDSIGRVLWTNPAFVALCRSSHEISLKGQPISQALGDDRQQWAGLLARVRSRGIVGLAQVLLQVPGAGACLATVSAALLAEGDQEHIGFTLRLLDAAASSPLPEIDALSQDLARLSLQVGQDSLAELLRQAHRSVEVHFIQAALRGAAGRIDVAAQALQLSVSALVERMHEHGLALPDPAGRDGLPPRVN